MIIHCPVCDSEKTKHVDLVRLAGAVVEARECLACGERFLVDDLGNEVRPPSP